MTEKYIAPTHLGEPSTTSLIVETFIYNCAFSKNHQSILHTLPPLMVEMICALHVFFLILRIHLSNIRFQYGVSIIPAYSSPFSRLSSVFLSMI